MSVVTLVRLMADDDRFGLSADDLLFVTPYPLDPEKWNVLARLDGYDPGCNVYRRQVEVVTDPGRKVGTYRLTQDAAIRANRIPGVTA